MKNRSLVVLLLILLATTSCVVKKQQYGNYENQIGKEVVYDKGKEIYLFWDQVPLQKLDKDLDMQNYEKVVKRNVFDTFITYGTIGIVSYYSVKINVKEQEQSDKE
ncbi:MAG: hypothetical protein KQH79_11195 [Bacteroidetes bacterium]|nr:hypothetical protein [Bacteroidota bacterium]